MPTPFSSLTPVGSLGESKDVAQPQAEVPPRPASSLGFTLEHPQQQFLHDAVACIGTELEEMHSSAAPLMRVRGGLTNAHRHRQALKYAFAKHSESECDRLRHDLSLKEAEVRDLRLKVQQMERWVQATKHATQKRKERARAANGGAAAADPVRSSSQQVSRPGGTSTSTRVVKGTAQRETTQKNAEDSMRETVSETGGDENKDSPVKRAEEWQQGIARQSEFVKVLKAKIQDAEAQLNRSTVQKKSMEMGLFLAESEVLKLRALTKRSEERATELANELKRVYMDLPKVMEKRIAAVAKTTSLEIRDKELEKLKIDNREEHFKFLDSKALVEENEGIDNRIAQLGAFCEQAKELLTSNRDITVNLENRTHEARESMGYLQQIWSKMLKRSLELQPSQPIVAGEEREPDENPELLLYRAGSGLDACLDLLIKQTHIDVDCSGSPSPTPGKKQTLSGTAGSN